MMKKIAVFCAMVTMMLLLTACGGQKNDLDIGHDLVKQGDCAGAKAHLDTTIAQPQDLLDLAYAYFLKGRCAEKADDLAGAYENYYAAKIVACFEIAHSTHYNLNTYGRSDFCQRRIPEMLKELAPKVGKDKVASITDKVDKTLHARYLERFAKKN